MKRYGLIGYPLGHSLSPEIHKRLFEMRGITDNTYDLFEIPPEKLFTDETLDILYSLDGFNVTIPHKVGILPLLDDTDGLADIYGSVNTVFCDKEGLPPDDDDDYDDEDSDELDEDDDDGCFMTGFNTDGPGFTDALFYHKIPMDFDSSYIIYGAGGAARAAAFEIAINTGRLTIAVRDRKKGAALRMDIMRGVRKMNAEFNEVRRKLCGKYIKEDEPVIRVVDINTPGVFDTVINATPVGMSPDTDGCAVPDSVIANCKNVFDMVYNPRETALVKKAKAAGKNAASGMAMLVFQAAQAQLIWEYGTDDTVYDTSDLFNKEDLAKLIETMENLQ
jgi:shikimate dehydrogenase